MRKIELLSIRGLSVVIGVSTLIIVFFMIFYLQLKRNSSASWYTSPITKHKVIGITGRLTEMWSQSGVYAGSTSQKMTAAQGVLFINGSLEQTKPDTILALNGKTGVLLWQLPARNLTAKLYANSAALYVGFGGTGQLGAYDLHTGRPYWITRLPNSRSVIRLYSNNSLIQTESTDNIFHLVEADTGRILQALSGVVTLPTIQALEEEIQTVMTPTLQIESEFYQNELFTENIKFQIQDEDIRALDRQTNDLLWGTEHNRISNIAVTNSVIYFLNFDGRLFGLDAQNGERQVLVQFDTNSFTRYSPEGYVRNYYIATDEDEGFLYVLLGDSRQVFAFKIME